jgi:hypothetical protein
MSMSPESPERLAEVLLEILELTRASQSKCARERGSIESFGVQNIEGQFQRRDEKTKTGNAIAQFEYDWSGIRRFRISLKRFAAQ